MIKVGIFWAVPDKEGGQTIIKISKACDLSEADGLGFINYRYSHFEIWDYVRKKRTNDCYKYPRGRVIYDGTKNMHLIYADKCISEQSIEEVIEAFEIENFELRGDEHYVCRGCEKKND